MIAGRRVIALVPARAGSKAIKNKNLQPLGGHPLLAWPIIVARHTPLIDRVIVSTDGEAIAEVAQRYGAEVYERPEALAMDSSAVIDTVRDLTQRLKDEGEDPGIIVLLEATSPFRSPQDIETCLNRLVKENLQSIATFAPAHLNPHRAWVLEDGVARPFIPGAVPWRPRQELPEAWQLTGAVYAFDPHELPEDSLSILYGRMGAHAVSGNSSIDIDTEIDLVTANVLFKSSQLAALI